MDVFQAAAFQDIDITKIKLTDAEGKVCGEVTGMSLDEDGVTFEALLLDVAPITMRMPL